MAKKGVYVDPNICIGCTLCTQICPGVYEIQDDGKSKAVNPTADTEENLQKSIDVCPVTAISFREYEE